MEWIVPANRDLYEHEDAFNKLPYIDWTQDCNYDVGDRVYIYTSTPYHKIEYLVEVIKTDIKSTLGDRFLTLVTDSNEFKGAKTVVVARRVRGDETTYVDTNNFSVNPKPILPKKLTKEDLKK